MSKNSNNRTRDTTSDHKPQRRLIENVDFTWAGWPEQYHVPLFTWEKLNKILKDKNGNIPIDMWNERIKK